MNFSCAKLSRFLPMPRTKRLLENYIEFKDVCCIYESVNGNLFFQNRDSFTYLKKMWLYRSDDTYKLGIKIVVHFSPETDVLICQHKESLRNILRFVKSSLLGNGIQCDIMYFVSRNIYVIQSRPGNANKDKRLRSQTHSMS